MSNKKRNVAYIKPDEPAFLARLKKEAGFVEGPTIDTKREDLPELSDEERDDTAEESPVVVVLKPGDLTKEEADNLKQKQELEEANKPAQLGDRIVFKPPKKREVEEGTDDKPKKKKVKSKPVNSKLLSFDEEELDD
ncbi:uncharacterized protein KIAA1143 homolog [Macrosteles quadrilineatus]|uniref:uncharacterized protein KIAA1143 homolog n=1 Tax=Macrosteles quadrilineatus TaxID=74068 RepID=UPI0023E0F282|nr:uncharacterized protein KIAA1143 homolog [Macrosteles quadrilineatus]